MVELSFQEAIALLRADEEKLKAYESQRQSLMFALQEIAMARSNLEAVSKGGSGLTPIGAGLLMPVKIEKDKVNADVGAGVVVEKNVDDAKALLDKREELVKDSISQIDDEITRLSNTVQDLSVKLQSYLKSQQGESDVPLVG
ncbi:MAG: prefoldin subunit alpha [Candidatus Diapherotrites archaeon]|nr:prefoldin subunit alpha [Candidatus Diapherotrites archaeon]